MKKLILFSSLILCLICISDINTGACYSCNEILISEGGYQILKIDSINHIYLVYAEKNDSIYKIMSEKEKITNCQSIKVGECYSFKIVSYFLPEEFHVKMRISGIKFKGEIIEIERDSVVGDLFTTNNLKGLCYIPDKRSR